MFVLSLRVHTKAAVPAVIAPGCATSVGRWNGAGGAIVRAEATTVVTVVHSNCHAVQGVGRGQCVNGTSIYSRCIQGVVSTMP